MLTTRIVTRDGCPICKFYIKTLSKQKYQFEQYDADVKENQKQLDGWRITDMPVVQIIEHQSIGDPLVVHQFLPGGVSSRAIEFLKTKIMKQREKSNAKGKT